MIYHFTRNHLSDFGYSNSDKEILAASQIHLKVLAPCNYYAKYDLKWLEEMPDKGLADSPSSKNWKMDSKFRKLPKEITSTIKSVDSNQALAAISGRSPLHS
jgi:hypothetical protein